MLNLSWHEVCEILDLSSLTRDQTYVPCIGRWVLNCWTSKEVPPLVLFEWLGFTSWIQPCLWFPKEPPYSIACFEPSFWAFISFFFLLYYLLSDYLFGISPWLSILFVTFNHIAVCCNGLFSLLRSFQLFGYFVTCLSILLLVSVWLVSIFPLMNGAAVNILVNVTCWTCECISFVGWSCWITGHILKL